MKKRDRREYDKKRYQNNKDYFKNWYSERKDAIKGRLYRVKEEMTTADNFKVLMSLKEYTELNLKTKKKFLELSFELQDIKKYGIFDIQQIIALREKADNLIRDYNETAKGKEREYNSSWNYLNEEEREKLIEKLAREKLRNEKLIDKFLEIGQEELRGEKQKLELAKFHEERGKENCPCGECELRKEIRTEIKDEERKMIEEYDKENKEMTEWESGECYNCGELKKVNVDSGICKKCDKEE